MTRVTALRAAGMEDVFLQAGYDFQRYITENMLNVGVASVPLLQAACTDVKGYEHLHGYKIRFEMMCLGKL